MMRHIKFDFNQKCNKPLTEAFDFNELDNNDNDSLSNMGMDDLALAQRSVTNVLMKRLETDTVSSFKKTYVQELKTPIIYKSVKNLETGTCNAFYQILCKQKWAHIRYEYEWEVCFQIVDSGIKGYRSKDADEFCQKFYADMLQDNDDGKISQKRSLYFWCVKLVDALGDNTFNMIRDYLKSKQVHNWNYLHLFASPDHGLWAMFIDKYNGFEDELRTKRFFVCAGFTTNNVNYPEAMESTPKQKRTAIRFNDSNHVEGLIRVIKKTFPATIDWKQAESCTMKDGRQAISLKGKLSVGELNKARPFYRFMDSSNIYKVVKNLNGKWPKVLNDTNTPYFPEELLKQGYMERVFEMYIKQNLYDVLSNESLAWIHWKADETNQLLGFMIADKNTGDCKYYMMPMHKNTVYDKKGNPIS